LPYIFACLSWTGAHAPLNITFASRKFYRDPGRRGLVSDPADLRHAGITDYAVLGAAFARPHRLPAEHEGVARGAGCANELMLMGSEPKPAGSQ